MKNRKHLANKYKTKKAKKKEKKLASQIKSNGT